MGVTSNIEWNQVCISGYAKELFVISDVLQALCNSILITSRNLNSQKLAETISILQQLRFVLWENVFTFRRPYLSTVDNNRRENLGTKLKVREYGSKD